MEIAIVAGEPSGDLLAAELVAAFLKKNPKAHFFGIGGEKMQQVGVEIIAPMAALSVMGYKDALLNLPKILNIRKRLLKTIFKRKPSVFVGVDAPDFNLNIEKTLKNQGFKTIHWVSPSVWAWRKKRIFKIKQSVDEIWTLFPFETALYQQVNVPAYFLGHPLADKIPLKNDAFKAKEALGLNFDAPVFAFLPGSRLKEVQNHADLFVQTANVLSQKIPKAQFVVPLVNAHLTQIFEESLKRNRNRALFFLLQKQAEQALLSCDVALVASGTATLEAALYKKPMVITYKLSPLTFWLAQKMVKTKWVGLPNVLCDEEIVPEILQNAASPKNLAESLFDFYHDQEKRQKVATQFLNLHQTLKQNAAENAARRLEIFLKNHL